MAKVRIELDDNNRQVIHVLDDDLTEKEKWQVRYAIYSKTNDSYQRLLKHLPKEENK